jgi:hypothetical protein
MKSAIVTLMTLAATASAQYYNVQSDGFRLIINSDNATLDG